MWREADLMGAPTGVPLKHKQYGIPTNLQQQASPLGAGN